MKYLRVAVYQNSRPGLKFVVVCGRNSKKHRWTVVCVGHAFESYQTAMKEGRFLVAELRRK